MEGRAQRGVHARSRTRFQSPTIFLQINQQLSKKEPAHIGELLDYNKALKQKLRVGGESKDNVYTTFADDIVYTLKQKGGEIYPLLSTEKHMLSLKKKASESHPGLELIIVVMDSRNDWKLVDNQEDQVEKDIFPVIRHSKETRDEYFLAPDGEIVLYPKDHSTVRAKESVVQASSPIVLRTVSSYRSLYSQKASLLLPKQKGGGFTLVACLSSGSSKRSMARMVSAVAIPAMSSYLASQGQSNKEEQKEDEEETSPPVRSDTILESALAELRVSRIAGGVVSDIAIGLESALTRMKPCGQGTTKEQRRRKIARGVYVRSTPFSTDPAHFNLKMGLELDQESKLERVAGNNWKLTWGNNEYTWDSLVHWKEGETYDLGNVRVKIKKLKRRSIPIPAGRNGLTKRLLMPMPGEDEYWITPLPGKPMSFTELRMWGFIVYTVRVSESIPLGWIMVLWILAAGVKSALNLREIFQLQT